MSFNTEHVAQLVKDLTKTRHHESATERDLYQLDLLTSVIETAENERTRLIERLRKPDSPNGASWAAIGLALGMTKQGAARRWGSRPTYPDDKDQLMLPE